LLYSRISCLHFSYYNNIEELSEELKGVESELQCVVSNVDIEGFETFGFGETQAPELWDYADGVDTMKFLASHINA